MKRNSVTLWLNIASCVVLALLLAGPPLTAEEAEAEAAAPATDSASTIGESTQTNAKWAALDAYWNDPAKWAALERYFEDPAKWAALSVSWDDPAKWAALETYWSSADKWAAVEAYWAHPAKWAATREALWGENADPAKWAAIETLWSSPSKWAALTRYWQDPAKWADLQAYWADAAKWAEASWPDPTAERAKYLMLLDPLGSDPAKWGETPDLYSVPTITKW